LKAAATARDVTAVRMAFALEAEEWYVEQFTDNGYSRGYLERFLDRPLEAQLLTNEERERLEKHLREVRKVRIPGGMERADGKPRNAYGKPREEPKPPVSPTRRGR